MSRSLNSDSVKSRAKATITKVCLLFAGLTAVAAVSNDRYSYFYFFSVAILAVMIFLRIKLKEKPEDVLKNTRFTDHGSARWANQNELIAAGLKADDTDSLWVGDGWTYDKQGHLLTVAAARQGKGTCLIIPALLNGAKGSFVVTDPKGENACITARAQIKHGNKVYILDPWGEQEKIGAIHKIPASGFNPFEFLKRDLDELRDNCESIAYFLVPDKPDVKDPFWNDRARGLVKTMLMHIVTGRPAEEHNFWTLYKMLRLSGSAWEEMLVDMKLSTAMDGLISIAAEEFIGFDPTGNTMVGIKSTAQNATAMFESPQLRKSLEKSDFDPYELPSGNCTVYIDIPERYLESHAGWLRLVIGLCLKACNSRPNKKVYFLLDEFAVMGKMNDVLRGYAFAAGQNIVLWSFVQSLSQLKQIYGEDGMNTIISNAAIFQCFGVKDQYTTQYVSKMLGDATYQKATKSFSSSTNDSSTSSTSFQSYGRPLLTPDEVEKIQDYIITIFNGLRCRIPKIPYYFNRYDGLNYKDLSISIPDDVREELKNGKLPIDWREIFADWADPRPRENLVK